MQAQHENVCHILLVPPLEREKKKKNREMAAKLFDLLLGAARRGNEAQGRSSSVAPAQCRQQKLNKFTATINDWGGSILDFFLGEIKKKMF